MEKEDELKEKLSAIVALTNLLRQENHALDIYHEITRTATEITDSQRSSLFIYDKQNNVLSSRIAQGMDEDIAITLDEGIAGYCGKNRIRVIENNAYENPLFNAAIDMQTGFTTRRLLTVPIIGKFDNLLGVLQVLNKHAAPYDDNDADLLAIVAELAASMIENHRIKEILKEKVESKTRALRDANRKLGEQFASEVALNQKLLQEKQLQEDLLIERSKLAELGKMIGCISHQMKQPLTSISVLSQTLEESLRQNELDEPALKTVTKKIDENIAFLSQTIDDFRLFVKNDRLRERFELEETVTGVLRLLAPLIYINSIGIVNDMEKGLTVQGYPNEFKQVVINLITNAIDQILANRVRKPQIKLIARRDGMDAVLLVRDNAGGIDPALLPDRLFEADVTTKGKQGTGLGLHMGKLIIENHMEGKITAANTEGGAEFTIRLPEQK